MKKTFTRALGIGFTGLAAVALLAAPIAAETVKITFATRPQSAAAGRFISWDKLAQQLIATFEAQHPDIQVEYIPLTGDWGAKLTSEMATGTAPDVFEMWGAQAASWGQEGYLLNLQPFIDRDKKDVDPGDFYPGDYRATLVPSGPYAGERVGLPRYTNASVIFYNATAFDEAGLAHPDDLSEQGKWTWDSLRVAAKKLTITQADKIQRYGYRTYFGDGRFAPWIWGNGGDIFSDPTHAAIGQPKAIEGLEYLHSLIWDDKSSTFGGNFQDGAIAFREQGSSDLADYGDIIGDAFEWNIAPLPVGPSGVQGTWVAGDQWAIARTTKHAEAAWQFLKFISSRQGMEMTTKLIGLPPSRFSAYSALRDAYPDRNTIYHMKAAESAHVLPYSEAIDAVKVSGIIDETVRASLEKDSMPIANAAKEAERRIDALYTKTQ